MKVSTLAFMGMLVLGAGCSRRSIPNSSVRVAPGQSVGLKIIVPEGFKLNSQAPQELVLLGAEGQTLREFSASEWLESGAVAVGPFPESGGVLNGKIFYCAKKDARICGVRKFEERVQISRDSDSVSEIRWQLPELQ